MTQGLPWSREKTFTKAINFSEFIRSVIPNSDKQQLPNKKKVIDDSNEYFDFQSECVRTIDFKLDLQPALTTRLKLFWELNFTKCKRKILVITGCSEGPRVGITIENL